MFSKAIGEFIGWFIKDKVESSQLITKDIIKMASMISMILMGIPYCAIFVIFVRFFATE